MLRVLLEFVLLMVLARAFWRTIDGVIEGLQGPRRGSDVPARGVSMVRDPVCGTYVLPDRAVVLGEGSRRVYFCSTACRDRYRARVSA